MPIKFLFWNVHPGDLLGEPIEFLTRGSVSHAGILRRSGKVAEAYWPKYRERDLIDAERPDIEAFTLRGLTPELEDKLEAAIDKLLAAPPAYSGWDLVRFAFNSPDPSENHTFCSRVVMHLCMQNLPPSLWPQRRVQAGDWVSPRDLYISNLLTPAIL